MGWEPRLAEEGGPVRDLQSLLWNNARDFPQCSDSSPEGRVVNEPHTGKARVFMGEKNDLPLFVLSSVVHVRRLVLLHTRRAHDVGTSGLAHVATHALQQLLPSL